MFRHLWSSQLREWHFSNWKSAGRCARIVLMRIVLSGMWIFRNGEAARLTTEYVIENKCKFFFSASSSHPILKSPRCDPGSCEQERGGSSGGEKWTIFTSKNDNTEPLSAVLFKKEKLLTLKTQARMLENVDLTTIPIKPFSNSNGNSKRNSRDGVITSDLISNKAKTSDETAKLNGAACSLKKYDGNCHCGQFKFSVQVPEFKSISECECTVCALVRPFPTPVSLFSF